MIEEIILRTTKPLEFEEKDGIRIYKAIPPNTEPLSEEIFAEFINKGLNEIINGD